VARGHDKLTGHQTLEESDKLLFIHDEYVGEDVEGKSDAARRVVIFCLGRSKRKRVLRFAFRVKLRLADLFISSSEYVILLITLLSLARRKVSLVIPYYDLVVQKHVSDDSSNIHH
jgi:hypothetical protein